MSIDKNSRAARQMRSHGRAPVRRKKKKRLAVWKKVMLVLGLLVIGVTSGLIYYVSRIWNMTADLDVNMEEITFNPNLDIETETIQKGFWKVAVFGVDSTDGNIGKGANSDVIIICSVNRENGEIKMVSVYRDTYLKVGDKNPYRKINEAYARGGPEQAMKALNENLDIAVDDFVAVNWKAVADGINILGGVDIEVTEAEFKQINGYITSVAENTGIYSEHLKKPGFQHLDGVQAVAYCRLRKMDTDFQRTQRQREVIAQCLAKAKKVNLSVLNAIIEICLPQVAHSLEAGDLLDMARGISRYNLGDTAGFPFDLKVQDIGKLDCVVPVTLESNVIKLHQFLFGTEDYKPSSQVKKISEDIAYNSAKQADSGEDVRQEDMEKMTSTSGETEERKETQEEESSEQESTAAAREPETDEFGNVIETTTDPDGETTDPLEGEDPATQSDEYVPDDQLIGDPGLRRPTEEGEGPGGRDPSDPSAPCAPTTNDPGANGSNGPGAGQPTSPGGSTGRTTDTPGGNTGNGTGNSAGNGTGNGTGNGSGNSGQGTTTTPVPNPSGITVYDNRPVTPTTEPSGIEGGPGFFQ